MNFLFACKVKVLVGMFTGCIGVVGHQLAHTADSTEPVYRVMVHCNKTAYEDFWNWSSYSASELQLLDKACEARGAK